jgi:hypothetical protein
MSEEAKTKKDNKLVFGVTIEELINNGQFCISIRLPRLKLRDSMKSLVFTSIDHSTLYQSFHSTELLRCTETPTCGSEDGERTRNNNNSGSMKSQRPSGTTTGRTIALTSKEMVAATTSELSQALPQDGGRCLDGKMVPTLPTREERSWQSMEDLIMSKETLSWKIRTVKSTKDGELYMLKTMKMNQLKVNSTRNSAFMLKEISTSSHNLLTTDILT